MVYHLVDCSVASMVARLVAMMAVCWVDPMVVSLERQRAG